MRVHAVEGVLIQRVGAEAVLLHPTGTQALTLSATALAVWTGCAEVADVEDVLTDLGNQYGIEPESIRDDVMRTVEQLTELGFIDIA